MNKDAKKMTVRLVLTTVVMFAFAIVALPPLYDAFCEITGLGGKTNQVASNETEDVVYDREIRLEFDTTVNEYAPWEFDSNVPSMTIQPGGMYEANFTATNLVDRAMVAQAVPSVAPAQAAKYFKKLDCFCFTSQEFEPGETKEMPVRFIVRSDLPDYIDTITLSYTFFDTAKVSDNRSAASRQ